MPLQKREPFRPIRRPMDLRPEEEVFFCPLTKEIFRDYDAFFNRIILLNSLVWTCNVTGRSGLTFEEALQSEETAQESLNSFPQSLEKPLLYISTLTCRGRIDDMTSDVWTFMKDRYFLNEEIEAFTEGTRRGGRIVKICDSEENGTLGEEDSQLSGKKLKEELRAANPGRFKYDIKFMDEDSSSSSDSDSDNDEEKKPGEVKTNMGHHNIFRQKNNVTKIKLKLFLKNACEPINDKWTVKPQLAKQYELERTKWTDIFAGPVPEFPRTPLSKRLPNTPGGGDVDHLQERDTSASSGKKKEPKKKTPKKPSKEQIRKMEEARKREEEERKMAKVREKQREELNGLLNQASLLGVKDVAYWTAIPEGRLIRAEEMNDLRVVIKKAREEEKERLKEEKKKEKEAFLEWKRPRDDLMCDDLKPLPNFVPVELPHEISPAVFGDILGLMEFFHCFKDQMTHETEITLQTVVEALFSNDQSEALIDLFVILLEALSLRQDEEDGDEANLDNKEELQCENSDLDSQLYGLWIKESTSFSEKIRLTHGVSVRNLHRDASTITELVRLNLLAAGYYTGQATARFRYLQRGGYRCYDDHCLIFKMKNPGIMEKLAKESIFSLNPAERMELLKVFSDQLLTFYAFRDAEDARNEKLKQLKTELRQLKMSETQMEKDAKNAQTKREMEEQAKGMIKEKEEERKLKQKNGEKVEEQTEPIELPERSKPGKIAVKLKKLLGAMRECGAYATFDSRGRTNDQSTTSDVTDKIGDLLGKVVFGDLELEEITETRNLQKQKFLDDEARLYQEIFDLQTSCGLGYLGRDRAYRTYWLSGAFPGVFVEEASTTLGDCEEPTPLDKVPQRGPEDVPLKGYDRSEEQIQLRKSILGCTGDSEKCAIHGYIRRRSRPAWSFLGSAESLCQLLDALNPRGYRELELSENLKFLRPRLKQLARSLSNLHEKSGGRLLKNEWIEERVDGETPDDSMEESIREGIKDLEEKVQSGGIGALQVRNRDVWRESLSMGRIIDLQTDCIKLDGEVHFQRADLDRLNKVSRMAVALLQVAQGISYKFIKLPFVEEASEVDEETGESRVIPGKLVPTLCFRMWQKSLIQCTSLSQIALHSWTLEPTVLWKKSKLQAKCRSCRKRGNPQNLVLCILCQVVYHTDCLKPVLASAPEVWKCRDCLASEKVKLRLEQRKAREEESGENGFGQRSEVKSLKPWKGDLFDDELSSESGSDTGEDCGECGASVPPKLRCVCDDCGTAYHPRCVGMRGKPKTDWLCGDCRPETNGFGPGEEQETKEMEPLTTQRGRIVKRKRTFDDDEFPKSRLSKCSSANTSRVSSGTTTPTQNGFGAYHEEPPPRKSSKIEKRHSTIGADLSEEDIRSLSMGLRAKGEMTPEHIRLCVRLMEDARRHEDAWPFMDPVDKKTPHYYDIIEKPMDLRTILNKLKGHKYDYTTEVLKDVQLMFENCRTFNEDGSVVSDCGKRLEQYLLNKMKDVFTKNFDQPVPKKIRRTL